eukprot:349404_1
MDVAIICFVVLFALLINVDCKALSLLSISLLFPSITSVYTYNYYVDLYPSPLTTTSTTFNITHAPDGDNSYYYVHFTPRDHDCIAPSVTFEFEEDDFDQSYEYLLVANNAGNTIKQCSGSLRNCGHWLTCFTNTHLEVTIITTDSSYKITVYEAYQDGCSGLEINARLTMQCNHPTTAPTNNPTEIPTQNPTPSPTNNPTSAPTITPILAPTISPTISPTFAQTITPTFAPTISPTISPSHSPSQIPTSNPISSIDFDSYVSITYALNMLTDKNKHIISYNPLSETQYIESVIKYEYRIDLIIPYPKYMVSILQIQATDIGAIDTNSEIEWININQLTLNAKIECNADDEGINYCQAIIQESHEENDFADNVQMKMRKHYENEKLLFNVLKPDELFIKCKSCPSQARSINYSLYFMCVITGILFFVSLLAFLFNKNYLAKFPGSYSVDNAKWTALILLALYCWDVYSDINLCAEIVTRDDLFHNSLIFISGFGSVCFLLLPYSVNLFIASKIKEITKNNTTAQSWFENNTKKFATLVVLTGSVYTALAVVSSRLFGLKMLSCGLTEYELKRLQKLRFVANVILENMPQIFCQALYALGLSGSITPGILIAFVTSCLSVIASALSYVIQKDDSNTSVVEYYVLLQCSRNDLTNEEKTNMKNNSGKTHGLAKRMAEIYQITEKNIEVGYPSMMTLHGLSTHIVHYVSENDLKMMNVAQNTNLSPTDYVQKKFVLLKEDLLEVWKDHFSVNDEFDINFSVLKGVGTEIVMFNYVLMDDDKEGSIASPSRHTI